MDYIKIVYVMFCRTTPECRIYINTGIAYLSDKIRL